MKKVSEADINMVVGHLVEQMMQRAKDNPEELGEKVVLLNTFSATHKETHEKKIFLSIVEFTVGMPIPEKALSMEITEEELKELHEIGGEAFTKKYLTK